MTTDILIPYKTSLEIDNLFKDLGPIEKNIHISWKNKNILDLDYNIIKNGIFNLKHLNPDYNFEISDDNDIDAYLKCNLTESDYLLIQNKHIVEKTDLWRLFKVFNEGGIYMDIDRLCNISFSSILNNQTIKCVIPTYKDMDFSQDIMISCSKNPFHKKTIELNLQRRREGETRIVYLGPDTYLHAISELLLGFQIQRVENNIEYMTIMRDLIINSIYLTTTREDPPFNTILYNGPNILFDKDLFYEHQNVSHHSCQI
jgi:mannosyltransferase OCH1-like enzyme